MLHFPEPPVRLWSHAAAMTAPDAAIAICLFLLIALLAHAAELRRAHAALALRNRQLESATEAKSRFIANLSHELRNPLNAVIGFAELMQDERRAPVAGRQREHLGIIRASGEHLLTLIDEALDMSRVEAGHVRLEPEEIEPTAIAAVCATSLGRLAAAKAIRIDLDPRPLGTVRLDPARLRQVILNYLSNAIKFTGEGGTVRIGLEYHHGRLLVEVSDTGQGIDPADHHRVFEEFVQLPSGNRSGSGLGLAVTKLVVEAQGGEVGVRSRPGVGSTFSAWLPAPAVPPARTPAVPPAGTPALPDGYGLEPAWKLGADADTSGCAIVVTRRRSAPGRGARFGASLAASAPVVSP